MGLDRSVARRLADQHLARWRDSTSYAELAYRDEHRTSEDLEVTEAGVTYRVSRTVWQESDDRAYTMAVKVSRAQGRGLFRSSVVRTGRMRPDGSFEAEV
jgi:hypothetical protein